MPRRIVPISAWASAVAFLLTGLFPFFNADGFGHLAQGRQIAALGHVPRVDHFSFWRPTPQPWTNYEWAYDLSTWWLYEHLGAAGLVWVKAILLGLLGYALIQLAVRLAANKAAAAPLALIALLLVLPIARFRFTVRPQIIGLVFPAFLLLGIHALYREDQSRRTRWLVLLALFVLQVVWVNAHGSHLLAIAISVIFLGVAWSTPAFRWLAGLIGLQLIATACTPFGVSILTDAVAHIARPEFRDAVTEWAPWSPTDPLRLLIGPMVVSVLVLVALPGVTRSGRFGLGYAVFCVLLCFMAFRSTRFVAHQVLFSAPLIAAGLTRFPAVESTRTALGALVVLAVVGNVVWTSRLVPNFGFGWNESRRDYPWTSAALIDREVEDARVLATIQDSWPMMFAAPSARFLVDGRVPFYGPEFVARVTHSFANPRAFGPLLDEFEVNLVVTDNTRADHVAATDHLVAHPGWRLVLVEDGHSLFAREGTADSLPALSIVGPGFRTGKVLEHGVPGGAVEAEIARVDPSGTDGPLHGWLRGLQKLRLFARQGDRAGLRMSDDPLETEQAMGAYALLSTAANAYPGFTSIELYRAMAAASACELEDAQLALARASFRGDTRETTLAGLEIALRDPSDEGREAALAHLSALLERTETSEDPWVRAIAGDADRRCP